MGLSRLTHGIQQGFMHGKKFLGQAYMGGKKFLSHLDNYAGIARGGGAVEWPSRFCCG